MNAACPQRFSNLPSRTVWGQLIRAADSQSSNLGEAEDASSPADFLYKMRIALREVKETRRALGKVLRNSLNGFDRIDGLEQQADELAAIFATIIIKTNRRIEPNRNRETQRGSVITRG